MIGSNQNELAPGERFVWRYTLPIFLIWGVGVVGPFFTGVSVVAVGVAIWLYFLRMFFITGFYHRYFSHLSYKVGRVMQFCMACCGCTAMQKGPIWWPSHHRHHHQHSDTPDDVHSCKLRGLWWSHVGWILCRKFHSVNEATVPDLLKFPELRWLDRDYHHLWPVALLALACFGFGSWLGADWGTSGWQMLIWGFFISTVVLFHATSTINSLAHLMGRKRYKTGDESRNSFFLAIITMGEGWHNNHHHYPATVRQGFYWWEIDLTYYILRLFEKLGIIWDMNPLPDAHRENGKIAQTPAPAT